MVRERIKQYSPEGDNGGSERLETTTGETPAGEERNSEAGQANGSIAEDLADGDTGTTSEGGDQANVRADEPILGVGPNGAAGGLSGDGERTDEYDAAVMGLDD